MNLLIDHSPAENLLLRDKGRTRLKTLLEATLLDLVLKEVLELEEIHRRPHPLDDVKRYVYVQKGRAFVDHAVRGHEQVFLKPFEYGTHQFLFRNLVRLAFEGAGNERSYRACIMNDPSSRQFWTQRWNAIGLAPSLSPSGKTSRELLLTQVMELEKSLVPWLEEGDPRAFEQLKRFGGNVLLVSELPMMLLPQFKESAMVRKAANGQEYSSGDVAYSGWSVGVLHHKEHDHAFEHAEDGTGNDTGSNFGGSGGGGDSGCSGCSGCGGCGGCGS